MEAEKRCGHASSDISALPLVQEEIKPVRRLPIIRRRRLRSTAHCLPKITCSAADPATTTTTYRPQGPQLATPQSANSRLGDT